MEKLIVHSISGYHQFGTAAVATGRQGWALNIILLLFWFEVLGTKLNDRQVLTKLHTSSLSRGIFIIHDPYLYHARSKDATQLPLPCLRKFVKLLPKCKQTPCRGSLPSQVLWRASFHAFFPRHHVEVDFWYILGHLFILICPRNFAFLILGNQVDY